MFAFPGIPVTIYSTIVLSDSVIVLGFTPQNLRKNPGGAVDWNQSSPGCHFWPRNRKIKKKKKWSDWNPGYGLAGDAFTWKYIISLFTLTLGQRQTQNVAQYPLHHMTYAPTMFEAAMSNGLGGNAFTRNIWFDHEALPSTSCDLCTCKVWSSYGQWLRRCITKKIHYLTLTPKSRGLRSHEMLPSTLDIMWPMHQQSLMLLHPMDKEKMHLQENNSIWPCHIKYCPVPSTSCDLCTYRFWSQLYLYALFPMFNANDHNN